MELAQATELHASEDWMILVITIGFWEFFPLDILVQNISIYNQTINS